MAGTVLANDLLLPELFWPITSYWPELFCSIRGYRWLAGKQGKKCPTATNNFEFLNSFCNISLLCAEGRVCVKTILLFFSLLCIKPAPSSKIQHPVEWPASTYGQLGVSINLSRIIFNINHTFHDGSIRVVEGSCTQF